ncbi:hypothetical protein L208DRAFT_1496845, partial [Tricholoma matsutake]
MKIIAHIIISTISGCEDKPPASLTDMFYVTEEDPYHVPIMLVCKKLWLNVCATQECSESPFHL